MKRNYIFLFIIFMFIVSCGNKITGPSENIDGITYYDPSHAETKEYPFLKSDVITGAWIEAKSTFNKVAESQNAIIYLEKGYNIMTRDTIMSFVKQFEEYYSKEVEIYGNPSDLDLNGKIIFLMGNLNTNQTKEKPGIGGYFYGPDLTRGKGGVKGEYLHVDPSVANEDYILGVMMHELQHLINFNVNYFNTGKEMDVWLDEGLAESTSHIFSKEISDSRLKSLDKVPYYSFYSWYFKYPIDGSDAHIFGTPMDFASYGPASMFMKWLDIKTGGNQEIYKKIAHSSHIKDGEQRVIQCVQELNPSLGTDMNTLLINWIKGINNGEVPGLSIKNFASTSDNYYNLFLKNGKTLLLSKALIICTAEDANKINDPKIIKEDLKNGNYIVLNTSQNQYAGYSAETDIVPLSLTKAAAQNSRYNNITESTMFKDNYFIDRVITEKDIIRK